MGPTSNGISDKKKFLFFGQIMMNKWWYLQTMYLTASTLFSLQKEHNSPCLCGSLIWHFGNPEVSFSTQQIYFHVFKQPFEVHIVLACQQNKSMFFSNKYPFHVWSIAFKCSNLFVIKGIGCYKERKQRL